MKYNFIFTADHYDDNYQFFMEGGGRVYVENYQYSWVSAFHFFIRGGEYNDPL